MLRSLVGSEMCIRDRVLTIYFLASLPTIKETLYTFSPGSRRARTRYLACLLYTSDAADDLLCVDLGGRRIIKKKKSIH